MHDNVSLAKLKTKLNDIEKQAREVDQFNLSNQRKLNLGAFFNENVFVSRSDKLSDYVIEVRSTLNNLQRMLNAKQQSYITHYAEKLEDQIHAIVQAIRANDVKHKSAEFDKKAKYANYQKKMRKAATHVMQSSHEMYAELAQHHEYERRLQEMIDNRNVQLNSASGQQGKELQQEILALHQRLGRCRQAISKIEYNIARAEARTNKRY